MVLMYTKDRHYAYTLKMKRMQETANIHRNMCDDLN